MSRQYRTELTYDGPTVFTDKNQTCSIICNVYDWGNSITQKIIDNGGKFSWVRTSNLPDEDDIWNKNEKHINIDKYKNPNPNQITITHEDVVQNAQFICEIQFDDTILKEGE